jgi:hypothetical protein
LLNTQRQNKLAGAVMWCFNDYWSDHSGGVNPMGAVDHLRIPKAVYYLFRKYWTAVPDSVPVPGLAISQLRLDRDMDSLVADSTDVAIITASLRSSDGRCVDNTNVGANTDSIPVTFTVSGPANAFGTGIVKAYGGKCALMIKSTNTPGTITISASANNMTAAPVSIKSVAPDTSSLPFLTPVRFQGVPPVSKRSISILQRKNFIIVSMAKKQDAAIDIRIVNLKGEMLSCPVTSGPTGLVIDTKRLPWGNYMLSIGNKGQGTLTKKMLLAQ